MDDFTEKHFQEWLSFDIPDDDAELVEKRIRMLVADHPDLLNSMSWPEMRCLAERNYFTTPSFAKAAR